MGRHRPATTRSQPWRLVCVAMVASVLNVPASTQTRSSADARAAISGRVIDEFGDPVIRGHVIVEVQTAPGATRQIAAADADDRGEYRIGLLPAGDYLVSVLTVDAVFITPQAIVFGSRSGPPQKMYYPGTRDSSDAEPLRIKAGEERDRIDFVLPAPAPPLLLPPAVEARRRADGVPAPGGSAIIRGRVVASGGSGRPERNGCRTTSVGFGSMVSRRASMSSAPPFPVPSGPTCPATHARTTRARPIPPVHSLSLLGVRRTSTGSIFL